MKQLIKLLTPHRRALAGLFILGLLGLLTWANPADPPARAGDTLADAWRRLGQAIAPPAYAVAEGRPLGQGSGSGSSGGPVVRTVAQSDSTVYAGGAFNTIGGQSRDNLAALDAATGSVLPWNPDANGPVHTLVISGSTIYAGGEFTDIGGQSRLYLAALNAASGSVLPWIPGLSMAGNGGAVLALAAGGSAVYAGGLQLTGGGNDYFAALDATTGNLLPWPDANGIVRALAIRGSTVYAGGEFTAIGGQGRNNIAALDAASGSALPWNPNANGPVRTLAISGNTLYAGGTFTAIGNPDGLRWQAAPGLAAFDISTPIYLPLIFKN
ncbi:MAG: hypothetical protein Fur0044_32730 [Anaerolineae bacterium]